MESYFSKWGFQKKKKKTMNGVSKSEKIHLVFHNVKLFLGIGISKEKKTILEYPF